MKLREEEFYEQYHQHGGTTIIPTEIFNELYDDATEEIERLNKINKKATRQIEILLEIALEQDSENVNLIDRLRGILNILQGSDSNE